MNEQGSFLIEALRTITAFEGSLAGVNAHVTIELRWFDEGFLTEFTLVIPLGKFILIGIGILSIFLLDSSASTFGRSFPLR